MRMICVFVLTCSVLTAYSQAMVRKTNEFYIQQGAMLPNTGMLPAIEWVYPEMEYTSSTEGNIHVEIFVRSASEPRSIKLKVSKAKDGSTLAEKTFSTKQTSVENGYRIKSPVFLPDGMNNVVLEVTTAAGVVISEKRQVLVGKDNNENLVAVDRKDYVLLFATDKYDNWKDLVNPVDDAREIARELKERYGFVVELVEDPTVEVIWEKLRDYNERKFAPQDQLMVFFAGHGHYDETFGEGYVVAKNSLSNDASRNSYVSHNRLRGVINNIPCNHIFLVMDVCFGGTLDPIVASSRGSNNEEVSVNQMLVRKWSHRTRKYLTSGGKEYVSDGVKGKHSPFAARLIETFRAMGGDDRVLTLVELQANLEKLQQIPRTGSFGTDEPLSDFVFVAKH